jgi:hypothetical protein
MPVPARAVASVEIMGQPVAVIEKPSSTPGMLRFEANRNLTGMGHERFRSVLDAVGVTPSAELARRLFATGRIDALHIFGNFITIDLAKGYSADGLSDVVRDLYRYWQPGMVPPSFEDSVEVVGDRWRWCRRRPVGSGQARARSPAGAQPDGSRKVESRTRRIAVAHLM